MENCQEALDNLKSKLVTAPILRGPNWALPFHIHTDASNKAIGAALGQVEQKLPYAIYFVSKNNSLVELNYTFIC
ncbi:ribonuclease H family protein, partial [Actinobacillus pleuropneumoniae]|uniref:ribonuclease H family protein n=1 Tax=Actinobacillus pleuropneumoniae TaxID=715 RepID=UPI0034DD9C61